MKAYTYINKGEFALIDKPKPTIIEPTDAIIRVTLGSICSSDLHIKHGSVPRAVPGITVGHEMVGIEEFFCVVVFFCFFLGCLLVVFF